MLKFIKRYLPINLLVLLSVLAVGLHIQDSDYSYRQQLQNILFDNLNKTYPREPSDQVMILDIDEKSLDRPELGQWPWPRPIVAKLIEKLHEYDVKVMGFDMVFAEADNTSPEQVARAWRKRGTSEEILSQIKGLESHDKIMAKSIRATKNVVLGLNFEDARTSGSFGFTPRPKAKLDIEYKDNLLNYVYPFDTVANYPILSRFSFGEGHFFATPDGDGIYRKVPMFIGIRKKNIRKDANEFDKYFFYPSLTSELLRYVAGGKTVDIGSVDNSQYKIEGKNAKFAMPIDEYGQFYVWYAKPKQDWYVSAYDVLNDKVPKELLKDKIILVGTSAIGLKDIRSTPLNPNRPGVEVHLNIVDQILQGAYIHRPKSIVEFEKYATILLGIIMILASRHLVLTGQTMVMLGGVTASFLVTNLGYSQYGLLIDGAYPAIVLFFLYVASMALSYLSSERDRQKVRMAFEHYISPSYMNELAENPEMLKLGGEEKKITTLFSDIRGFTSICEGLTPDEIISLMNDFLTPLSKSIMEHRGTIDKYIGDAIMAFWNAPIDDEHHSLNACYTSLKMLKRLEKLNKKRLSKDPSLKPLTIGIGINTGLAAVGNMGSDQRFAYSVLGDSVNLASRLESQTKQYGVDILVGDACLQEDGVSDLALLEVDLLRVKGRMQPARIYTLVGDEKVAATEEFKDLFISQEKFLEAYRAQDWSEALKLLKPCRYKAEKMGLNIDRLYIIYRQHIDELREASLPKDWDGVYIAQVK